MTETCRICSASLTQGLPHVVDAMTGESFSVLECASCGLGYTTPRPEDFAKYYPVSYYGGRHGVTASFCIRRRLRWIGCAKGRLLDIGCGDGSFLLAARRAGWEVAGVERNTEPARRAGLRVAENLEELTYQGLPQYDRITLWHSLEHITEGPELIRKAAELLAPGGRLVIAVPDAGGWQARLFGAKWLHLDVPRHVCHYTPGALKRVCEKAGLRVERMGHQEFEYDLLGWSQSLLNALFVEPNVFFHVLTGKPVRAKGALKLVQVGLGLMVTALCVPLVWLGAWAGQGGTVIVDAAKREG